VRCFREWEMENEWERLFWIVWSSGKGACIPRRLGCLLIEAERMPITVDGRYYLVGWMTRQWRLISLLESENYSSKTLNKRKSQGLLNRC
jgi:hypothetical protein